MICNSIVYVSEEEVDFLQAFLTHFSPPHFFVHPTPMLLCKALSGSFVVHQLFLLLLTFVMCAVICLTFLDDAVSTNRLVLMLQVGRFMHANTLKRDYIFCSKIQLEMGKFPVENFRMLRTVTLMSQKCLRRILAASQHCLRTV